MRLGQPEAHGSPYGDASSFMESASYELPNYRRNRNGVDIVRPVPKRTKQTYALLCSLREQSNKKHDTFVPNMRPLALDRCRRAIIIKVMLPHIQPINPTRIAQPFDHLDWIFELKHDGFRALAYVEDGTCRLISRKQIIYKSFGALAAALADLPVANAILDGELVCLGADGRSQFIELMRKRRRDASLLRLRSALARRRGSAPAAARGAQTPPATAGQKP